MCLLLQCADAGFNQDSAACLFTGNLHQMVVDVVRIKK